MVEYVYRPVRVRKGKRVRSPLFSGRYSIRRGQRPVTVPLHVSDKLSAVAKLREIVTAAQREAAGIVAPVAVREAAARPVADLIEAYRVALVGLGRDLQHVDGTVNRLLRISREIGWARLLDVRPDTFVAWVSRLDRAAKTRKEYQTSANAWLNWLVKTEQLPRNPLARLDKVETRGKQVREARSLRREEVEALLSVAGERRALYLFMIYTGLRKGEVSELRWTDLHDMDGDRPFVMVRVETAKGKKKRPVPLHPVLAVELRFKRDAYVARCMRIGLPVDLGARIFGAFLPRAAVLRRDLERAGIPYKDPTGRVLHFHALRKTFQTLGVVAGVNQRSAQALLGHSDPSLTAEVYTDVPALELHGEVAKLPRMGVAADAQTAVESAQKRGFRDVLAELIQMAQLIVGEPDSAPADAVFDGGRHRTRTGCEPVALQFCRWLGLCGGVAGDAQIEAGKLALDILGRVEGGEGGAESDEAAEPRNLREQLGTTAGFLAGGTSRLGATDARDCAPLAMTPGARSAVVYFARGDESEKGQSLAGGLRAPCENGGSDA